jgi:prepilin-type N-terminal cleavage/methylation domain-containing protein
MRLSSSRGFTLIEISIVMVVVALIIAGVIAGSILIRSAELRALGSQISELNAAIILFDQKYDCLPGDCRNADDLGFTVGSNIYNGTSGDGDGRIATTAINSEYIDEALLLRRQLQETNMMSGIVRRDNAGNWYTVLPMKGNPISADGRPGEWGTNYMEPGDTNIGTPSLVQSSGHYHWATDSQGNAANVLTPEEAHDIDQKLDDGLPLSGVILATETEAAGQISFNTGSYIMPVFNGGSDVGVPGAESNYCITNDTPNQYNVQNVSRKQGSLCGIAIQANF